jgi:predicted DNA-binding transcriptional regulator AlpA
MNETCEPALYDDAETRRHREGGPSYQSEPAFYTDDELCKRWRCTTQSLWRRRKAGTLPQAIKIGGSRNLTPRSVVHAVETR